MPSSAASTAMEAVVHYKKKLLRHVSDQESDVLLHCLVKLDRVPMTIDILQETGVGRVVNSLKKGLDPDSEVAQLARNIVVKWKDIVANHQEQEQKLEEEDGCDYEEEEEEVEPPEPEPEAEKKSKSESKKSSSSHKHKRHHKDKDSVSKSHSSSSKKKKKDKSKSKDRERDKERSSSSKKHRSESKSSSKSKKDEASSAPAVSEVDEEKSKPSSSKTNGSSAPSRTLVDAFEISPNYKPSSHNHIPPPPPSSHGNSNCSNSQRSGSSKPSPDEELSALMSKKGTRKTLYSGVKRSAFKEVTSLKEICIHVLQENVDNIEQCGGLPYEILEPVLMRASPQTLMQIEDYNQYLMDETGPLWEKHCKKEFPKCQREEFESYKEMYERCTTERAAKLEVLTAKMGTSYKNAKDNVRRTKLAFVNTVAKPPRSAKRAQERNGTALQQPPQPPAKRGRPSLGTGSGSGSVAKKPKIAPMMAKTLKLARGLKGGFRR